MANTGPRWKIAMALFIIAAALSKCNSEMHPRPAPTAAIVIL